MRGHRYYLDTLLVRKISKRHFSKDIENSFQEVTHIGPKPHQFFSFQNISTNTIARGIQSFGWNGPWQPMDSCCPTWLALNQLWIEISAWNFQHLFITCFHKFDKKNLAIAQLACQPQPILAKTLDASSDRICWDISKRKKLVRFWTYWSNLLKGFFNISKKMAFLIFWKSLWVHPHNVHELSHHIIGNILDFSF